MFSGLIEPISHVFSYERKKQASPAGWLIRHAAVGGFRNPARSALTFQIVNRKSACASALLPRRFLTSCARNSTLSRRLRSASPRASARIS